MTSPFARVEKERGTENEYYDLFVAGKIVSSANGESGKKFLQRQAKEINSHLHARCAPLLKALEDIASWREACHEYDEDMGHSKRDFDVDDVVRLEEMARKALEKFRGK